MTLSPTPHPTLECHVIFAWPKIITTTTTATSTNFFFEIYRTKIEFVISHAYNTSKQRKSYFLLVSLHWAKYVKLIQHGTHSMRTKTRDLFNELKTRNRSNKFEILVLFKEYQTSCKLVQQWKNGTHLIRWKQKADSLVTILFKGSSFLEGKTKINRL